MNALAISNEELTINTDKITVTDVGLQFHERLTDEEWTTLGYRIGRFSKAAMFMIGDWLIHREDELGGGIQGGGGKGRPGEIEERYETAAKITELNIDTLRWAATVCRKVPFNVRRRTLAFEHHKVVSKFDPETQEEWLKLAEKHNMGKRRLARSIEAGRVLTPKELEPDPNDKAIETFNPWVNRICILYGKFKDTGYMKTAHKEKREAMRRDLLPVVKIYEELGE